ncbi:MAG TPA: TatD family hydrolase [Chitinophagaceae bacterium]|nr:TatD family hydrolase [Chitinophagaceae bacterium]
MALIDTHSHIYLSEFDNDRKAMIERAEKEAIAKILMPAIDIETHAQMLETERNFPNLCISMMGLHPCSVRENYEKQLQIVHEFLQQRKFIAIGETGLDFYWDLAFKQQQFEAFQQQIQWALQYDLSIVIHSRNSTDECIEMIKKNQNGKLKGVFHCFSGTVEQAHQIIDLGFYLGIGGVLTFKKSGLDVIMEKIGLDHVVLETDAPYLAPVPFRGKRNECSYLKYVAQKLAEVKQMSSEEIAMITTGNAKKLFGL